MSIIEVHDLYNLGDQLINFIFFHQIKDYIEKNDIYINYYCNKMHVDNINDFNCSNNIKVFGCNTNDEYKGYHLWQGTTYNRHHENGENMLCTMFNDFLNHHNIPITVSEYLYQDNDILTRHDKLPESLKNLDILVINSKPRSGQYNYDKTEWDNFIIKLNEKHKIATTQYVNYTIHTFNNYRIKDIVAAATSAKLIIAINTGPLVPMFNVDVLHNVEKIYVFGSCSSWRTPKVFPTNTLGELEFLL